MVLYLMSILSLTIFEISAVYGWLSSLVVRHWTRNSVVAVG